MTSSSRSPRAWRGPFALVFALTLVAGCRCEQTIQRKFPEIEVNETLVDFGAVQKDIEVIHALRVYNSGAASLNISELRISAPFSVKDELPVSVGVGQEVKLQLAFKPTLSDKRYQGQLVIVSDDPSRHEVTVDLAGAGVTAVATADPSPVDFGDVYFNESKSVLVKIHNGGANTLNILAAELTPDTTAEVTAPTLTADLVTAAGVEPGKDVETTVTFKPTALSESIPGSIKLTLDPLQGSELVIPFAGRGVRAVPRLCFKFDDAPMEQCTTLENPNLQVVVPPLCDSLIYPEDGGTQPSTCGGSPYERKGQFYIRNEGNVPVAYSMQYSADVGKSCDGGTPERIDFSFANAPTPGSIGWKEDTTRIPLADTDPKPWETAPIAVSYRATAACPEEASDMARIFWTRQGLGSQPGIELRRPPTVLSAFFSGKSKLPEAVETSIAITAQKPGTEAPVKGAVNKGVAEFQIEKVELYEVLTPVAGASCDGTDAGTFQPCDFTNAVSDCYQWSYPDGGDPMVGVPHTIPVGDGGVGEAVIGRLSFNAKGTATPNQDYCVYTVSQTTDPFHKEVVSKIQGRWVP